MTSTTSSCGRSPRRTRGHHHLRSTACDTSAGADSAVSCRTRSLQTSASCYATATRCRATSVTRPTAACVTSSGTAVTLRRHCLSAGKRSSPSQQSTMYSVVTRLRRQLPRHPGLCLLPFVTTCTTSSSARRSQAHSCSSVSMTGTCATTAAVTHFRAAARAAATAVTAVTAVTKVVAVTQRATPTTSTPTTVTPVQPPPQAPRNVPSVAAPTPLLPTSTSDS